MQTPLTSGSKLDDLISKKVFGNRAGGLARYSSMIDFAWRVVEKMDEKGWLVAVHNCGSHGWRVEFLATSPNDEDVSVKGASSASEGICLAALKALGDGR